MKRSANKCELMLLTETKRSHTIPLVTSKSVIKKPKGKGDIIMKELNNNPEVTDVCNEKTACLCDSNERTPFSRTDMGDKEFQALVKKVVCEYANAHLDVSDGASISEQDVYIVWQCKTLQNNKALASTTLKDGMYYELTYDGDKKRCYVDAYKKWENFCVNGAGKRL